MESRVATLRSRVICSLVKIIEANELNRIISENEPSVCRPATKMLNYQIKANKVLEIACKTVHYLGDADYE